MDKNTITGFILLALLTVGYVFYSSKEQAKIEKEKAIIEAISKSNEPSLDGDKIDSSLVRNQQITESLGNFAELAAGESKLVKVENEDVIYTFDTKGGVLKSVELKHFKTYSQEPLLLFRNDENTIDLSFIGTENKVVHTKDLFFITESTEVQVSGEESQKIDFVLNFGEKGKYIHSYTIDGKGYLIDFTIKAEDVSGFISPLSSSIDIDWKQKMPSLESSIKEERLYSNVYYRNTDKNVDELSTRKNDDQIIDEGVQWVSFKQKFFNNTLLATNVFFERGSRLKVKPEVEEANVVKEAGALLKLPIDKGKDFEHNLQWYFGPNKYSDLKKLKVGLDEIIPLGWAIFGWVNKFLIIPVFNILGQFISNYGIIILILTVLLKLVLTPLNRKQLISASKMQILRPEIDELKKKYPNDKQMVGAKQMELFRNAGVNPMGGCLPILLQMPILFAMYRFFPNSIELRQESFLWADDLSHYDSILTLPFNIPIYGDHVSLFTLLMAITSFAYTKITMSQQQMSMGGNDDMMAMQMKIMQYLTPFMFLFMFNSFSAALSYYYFLFNLLSIIQTFAIKKFFIDESALRAEIEFNKKQPKKKSAWQDRVEQMMEQQKAVKEKKNK